MLLLGYIFTLLVVSYALPHRMGKRSAWVSDSCFALPCKSLRRGCQKLACCDGQQGWNMAVTFLLRPEGTAFQTRSMSSYEGAWWGISGGLRAYSLREKSKVTYLFSFLTESWAKIKPFVEQSQSLQSRKTGKLTKRYNHSSETNPYQFFIW